VQRTHPRFEIEAGLSEVLWAFHVSFFGLRFVGFVHACVNWFTRLG
jgi:hypothetical protein